MAKTSFSFPFLEFLAVVSSAAFFSAKVWRGTRGFGCRNRIKAFLEDILKGK